jgi:hypothetical protein
MQQHRLNITADFTSKKRNFLTLSAFDFKKFEASAPVNYCCCFPQKKDIFKHCKILKKIRAFYFKKVEVAAPVNYNWCFFPKKKKLF